MGIIGSSILIVCFVESYLFFAISFMADIFRVFAETLPVLWLFTATLVTAILSQGISAVLRAEKTRAAARFRFFIFYIAGITVLGRFFLQPAVDALMAVSCSVTWLLCFAAEKPFLAYHKFLAVCSDLSGEKLAGELRFMSDVTTDVVSGKKLFVRTVLILLICTFIACMWALGAHVGLSFATGAALIVFLLLFVIMCIILNTATEETFYASLGINAVFSVRRTILRTGCISFLCCFLCALLLAPNHALADKSIFVRWLLWLASLLEKDQVPAEQVLHSVFGASESFGLPEELIAMQAEEHPLMEMILAGLRYLFIGGIICAVLVFLFGPFFSGEWRNFWKEKRLFAYLKQFWLHFLRFIRGLFHFEKTDNSLYASASGGLFSNAVHGYMEKSTKSKEKQKELDRLTKLFVKIIDWGEKQGVAYRVQLAPAEYTSGCVSYLCSQDDTSLCKALKTCGSIFEKALYDKDVLSAEEEGQFRDAVETVLHEPVEKLKIH
ncbi:MAG: hypothetical protein J6W46_09025 [Spirochaetaceae bacterium]|nr:hypothetical protein [Spirochaetaceae bacterium]